MSTTVGEGAPLDFVSFHTKGGRFTLCRVYGPLGGPAPTRQSPSSLKRLREVCAALDAVAAHPEFRDLPCIVDECDASVPALRGVYDNANFAYRNTEYFLVLQCKPVTLKLEHLPFRGEVRLSHWRIDRTATATRCGALGAPQDPSERELGAIRERQELERLEPDRSLTVRDGAATLQIALPLPGVSLLEIRPEAH